MGGVEREGDVDAGVAGEGVRVVEVGRAEENTFGICLSSNIFIIATCSFVSNETHSEDVFEIFTL